MYYIYAPLRRTSLVDVPIDLPNALLLTVSDQLHENLCWLQKKVIYANRDLVAYNIDGMQGITFYPCASDELDEGQDGNVFLPITLLFGDHRNLPSYTEHTRFLHLTMAIADPPTLVPSDADLFIWQFMVSDIGLQIAITYNDIQLKSQTIELAQHP